MSSLYGVMAKFAAAGIPGGFNTIATSSNVFGHGMFAILFEKVYTKIFRKKSI